MKQTIEHLENLIRHDLADRHFVEYTVADDGSPVRKGPPHTEDRERIRDYVRALRVLRWVAARGAYVRSTGFGTGHLTGQVTDPEASNYGQHFLVKWEPES